MKTRITQQRLSRAQIMQLLEHGYTYILVDEYPIPIKVRKEDFIFAEGGIDEFAKKYKAIQQKEKNE